MYPAGGFNISIGLCLMIEVERLFLHAASVQLAKKTGIRCWAHEMLLAGVFHKTYALPKSPLPELTKF